MGSSVSTIQCDTPWSTSLNCSSLEGDVDNPRKHVGLQNETGENNCFLNSTIQALWHLDSFRQALINAQISQNDVLLSSVQGLFIQYQCTDLEIIPPTELRHVLSFYDSSKFQLGEKADASEALEAILHGIHDEQVAHSSADGDCFPRCVAHQVFGGMYLSQSHCRQCGATDEPFLDTSSFLLYTSAAALMSECLVTSPRPSFGALLQSCLRTPPRSCPSQPTSACQGAADTRTWCLESPAVLALCVSWESESVDTDTIGRFLSILSGKLSLCDIYRTDSLPGAGRSGTKATNGCAYQFRGFVCFYGRHYISIFQDWTRGKHVFLLFDDSNVREIGTWPHVVRECVRARYQPVLLLYERERHATE